MAITLTVVEGPHLGRVFRFETHDTFLVGRAPEAHLQLPDDPYFSRLHFMLEVNPPLCRLTDMGSRNGTMVNGKVVTRADLSDGTRIHGGKTVLRIGIGTRSDVVQTLDLPAASPSAAAAGTLFDAHSPSTTATGPVLAAPSTVPAIPGYTIGEEIGKGAMGVVYRGTRQSDRTLAAVKIIHPAVRPTGTTISRFLREADVLKSLKHSNIVGFLESGTVDGLLYIAMEFVSGIDADKLIDRDGPMGAGKAVPLMRQVLDALGHAHERGFVHRDIKPANLLIVESADSPMVKVADFGLARAYQSSEMSGLTMANSSGGTPLFMPPEQITDFRTVRPAADQYSVAATLYYLLTGRGPFRCGSADELFRKVLLEEPTPLLTVLPDVPRAIADAIHRALRRKPDERFRNVQEFRSALG